MHLVSNRTHSFFLINFGATIKQLRISDKISRTQFGNAVGLSVFKVGQLENGMLDIDLKLFYSITKVLSVSPATFFEIKENL
jgi:transcriptional regulator with XRE-family HTH domain